MRTLMLISLCALLALVGVAAYAQDQGTNSGRETLKAFSGVIPAPNFDLEAAKEAEMAGTGLRIFNYTIKATKDQIKYSGTMVGTNPFAKNKVTANIPTYIIPVIVVIGATSLSCRRHLPQLSLVGWNWENGHSPFSQRLPLN